jgi:hypothetical protein
LHHLQRRVAREVGGRDQGVGTPATWRNGITNAAAESFAIDIHPD